MGVSNLLTAICKLGKRTYARTKWRPLPLRFDLSLDALSDLYEHGESFSANSATAYETECFIYMRHDENKWHMLKVCHDVTVDDGPADVAARASGLGDKGPLLA